MKVSTVLGKSVVCLSVVVLSLSLAVQPTMAGHQSKSQYYSGKEAFKGSVRDYGRKVKRGAKQAYDRYGKTAKKFYDGVSPAVRSYKYRTPLPVIIVPKDYPYMKK